MRLLSRFVRTFTLFKIIRRKYIPWFQHVNGKLGVRISCERGDCPCGLVWDGTAAAWPVSPAWCCGASCRLSPKSLLRTSQRGLTRRPACPGPRANYRQFPAGVFLYVSPPVKTPSRHKTGKSLISTFTVRQLLFQLLTWPVQGLQRNGVTQ